ncbi:hypothetical protein GONAM_36_00010, partial [Gordonia namibiensis NBRC 108229]
GRLPGQGRAPDAVGGRARGCAAWPAGVRRERDPVGGVDGVHREEVPDVVVCPPPAARAVPVAPVDRAE